MKKVVASAILTVLMLFSTLAFVFVFFPPSRKESSTPVKLKPVYESLSTSEKHALLYEKGVTIVHYPAEDSFFNSTLSKLPETSSNMVVIELDGPFAIESANGYKETNRTSWIADLCSLMVRGTLPDCLIRK